MAYDASMITRTISKKLLELSTQYAVVAINGPRQSGKTTLVRHVFPDMKYMSLEDPDTREFAITDPRGFLSTCSEGAILDEVQRSPDLFSYIQTIVDEKKEEGLFILTGSFNFGLMEGITQSLAGRTGLLTLLPLSYHELETASMAPSTLEALLYKGYYPRIYDKNLLPSEWYANYLTTYLERDVRVLKKIPDLDQFQKFIKMCAGRCSQLLNLSSLGNDCGISHNTAKAWLSVLKASYVISTLQPHHKNFNKRLVKSPKLYFNDTGLLCYLLGISKVEDLKTHSLRGSIFESWVISELLKGRYNRGLKENLYFWRDNTGNEVDCIIEQGNSLIPLEIKSGETISRDFFKGLRYWSKISGASPSEAYLIYGGDLSQKRSDGVVEGWKSFTEKLPLTI